MSSDIISVIADALNFVLLVLTTVGVLLTRHQLKLASNIQKASFFKDLYLTMYSEPDIRNAFYLIHHGKFVYDNNFRGSLLEQSIDRLLCFVDILCGLYDAKMLTRQEMKFLEFELKTIYKNPEVQKYFEYLNELYKSLAIPTSPFSSFIVFCEKDLAFSRENPRAVKQ